jgi:dihydrofolate reductase
MGWVILVTNLTLDGVMQAPGRPDEDTRDGFKHGGWAAPYAAMMQAGEAFANLGGFLFGRRTYEDFARVWPSRTDNPFTEVLNLTRKYVVSTTTKELPWINSTLLTGMKAVSTLKKELDRDLVVFGSGVLVQSLMAASLIDEFVLLIHPLVLGSGRRLFTDGGQFASLTLSGTKTTDKGVLIATYHPTTSR